MNEQQQWFPLPDLYRTLQNPETLKKFALAYMERNHPGWKPERIRNYKVLAVKR